MSGQHLLVSWLASLLCGALLAVVVLVLGGPGWAAAGLGILGFWLQRVPVGRR